jgi:hypothetical protein
MDEREVVLGGQVGVVADVTEWDALKIVSSFVSFLVFYNDTSFIFE